MVSSTEPVIVRLTANGGATYSSGLQVNSVSELRLWVTNAAGIATLQTQGTHYTVSLINPASAAITFYDGTLGTTNTRPAAGSILTILRVTDRSQSLDLVANNRLPAQDFEAQFDKLTRLIREQDETRVPLRFHEAEPSSSVTTLPLPASRSNCAICFDATGGMVILPLSSLAAQTVTASTVQTALAADRSGARTALLLGTAATMNSSDFAPPVHNHSYSSLTGIPSSFTPSAHTHAISEVVNLQAGLDSKASIANPNFTGTVSGITASMVGLGGVNNTSDADKPVSNAQQAALNLKAPLASPALTGTPTVPTPSITDSSTKIASTAFVKAQNYLTSVPVASVAGRTGAVTLGSADITDATSAATANTLVKRGPNGSGKFAGNTGENALEAMAAGDGSGAILSSQNATGAQINSDSGDDVAVFQNSSTITLAIERVLGVLRWIQGQWFGRLIPPVLSDNRVWHLPDEDGYIALRSDGVTESTPTSFEGYLRADGANIYGGMFGTAYGGSSNVVERNGDGASVWDSSDSYSPAIIVSNSGDPNDGSGDTIHSSGPGGIFSQSSDRYAFTGSGASGDFAATNQGFRFFSPDSQSGRTAISLGWNDYGGVGFVQIKDFGQIIVGGRTFNWPVNYGGTIAVSDSSQTFSGSQTFTGQVELTNQAATNATSALTRGMGDERFGSFLGQPITQASSSAWAGISLGLLPFSTLRTDTSSVISTYGSNPPDIRFLPYWVPSTRTITGATMKIISGTNASQTVRGAIYDTGPDGMPNNRIGSQFSFSCAATGFVTAATGSITLNKGLYWLALQNSVGSTSWGGTLTVLGYGGGAFALVNALFGTQVSTWDTYYGGSLPSAAGNSSMPALGSSFSNKSITGASSQTFPAVLLK
jgi:hypothetical protein